MQPVPEKPNWEPAVEALPEGGHNACERIALAPDSLSMHAQRAFRTVQKASWPRELAYQVEFC